MAKNNDLFLAEYKNLENLIKKMDGAPETSTIYWLEQKLEGEEQAKLTLCRTCRNFLQHNDEKDFFVATEDMIDFIKKQQTKILANFTTCEKIMVDIRRKNMVFDVKDKLIDAVPAIAKYGFVIVYDGEALKGLYTAQDYVKRLTSDKITKTAKIETFSKVKYTILPKTELQEVADKALEKYEIVFIKDSRNKIVGYIKKGT